MLVLILLVSGLFVIDSICRSAKAKYGDKDYVGPRFALKMADTLASLADLSPDDLRSAKRVVTEWKRRSMFPEVVYPDFIGRPAEHFDPLDLPSPGQVDSRLTLQLS
jgi:hypothetical protein